MTVMGGAGIAVLWSFASQVELTGDDFEDLTETIYICTAEVEFDCDADVAVNQLALQGEDRVKVSYDEIPDVIIQAVVATEDKNFFEHQGVDPVGLTRAAYQVAKSRLTDSGGSLQGGSTITQQYIKLTSGDQADDVARKGREIVRAIKFEQERADELGSKEAAKQEILERYLNRIYFGRRSYGITAAARNYFDKDLEQVTLAEAAFLAGLIRNPHAADPIDRPEEASRRRTVTLALMVEQGYVTEDQRVLADQDPWTTLVRVEQSAEGLGDVKGSEYGTTYFVDSVRWKLLNDIFPQGVNGTKSLRVYTTMDLELQRLAYQTVNSYLPPNNPDMPIGALVSVDGQGRVVAMMAGSDWGKSQVNLVTGEGGSGFQPGSTMKPVVLAEFIEQGFSTDSLYANETVEYPEWDWKVLGRRNPPNHRTVFEATRWSTNAVYAQMIMEVGIDPSVDMAHRLGIRSDVPYEPSIVLGTNLATPLEMSTVYSTLRHEGTRLDPVMIERIEDSDGNVLCWYPTKAGDCTGSDVGDGVREREQVVDGSVARQVNAALVDVVANGTGKKNARLLLEDETVMPAGGKTGTTNDARDAWFTGFSCELTTSVWMGYPGVPGQVGQKFMSDRRLAEENAKREEAGEPPWPLISELFEGLDEVHGGDLPAQIWHDFMLTASRNDEPCEIPTEKPGAEKLVKGLELLTTLIPCAEPDPSLFPKPESTSTSAPEGGDGGGDEGAAGVTTGVALLYDSVPTFSMIGALQGPITAQDDNGRGNKKKNDNNGGNTGGNVIVPTTDPCLPIDLDGNVIEDGSTTTNPAGPTTVDPNSSSSSETTVPEDSTTTNTETTTTDTTEDPDTTTTEPPPSSTDGNGNGNGNGNGGTGGTAPDDGGGGA